MIKKLSEIVGVSGFEKNIINYIFQNINSNALDKIYVDNVGNLICYKKGKKNSKKVMISAHVDEVGIQIMKKIDERKYSFKVLGNIKCWNLLQQRMRSGNKMGIIFANDETNIKAYNYSNLFINIISTDDNVNIGDVFSFDNKFEESNEYICGKAIDNRICCNILIDFINNMPCLDNDIYCVFTVQEEIGMRGIRVAKTNIRPNIYINLDVSPESEMNNIEIKKGVGIVSSNSIGVSSCDLFKLMVDVAKKNNIIHQIEVSDCGTNELIISNEKDNGTKTIAISLPCKYIHTANTIVHKNDIKEFKKLLEIYIKNTREH